MSPSEKGLSPPDFDLIPRPDPGCTGWPWTKRPERLLAGIKDQTGWPRISIITPSFNQGRFLPETIRSVLMQGYPNIEYIVIDGGSTDDSVDVIKEYEPWLSYWISEPDSGQAEAINKGLARATGEWLCWLNSDDFFLPGALFRIARAIRENPGAQWIVGTTLVVDSAHLELGRLIPRSSGGPWYDYVCTRQSDTELPQPSSFWSRTAWLDAGPLDESFRYAMDHEYWGRLARSGFAPLCITDEIAAFRRHDAAKTSEGLIPFWSEEVRIIDKWLPGASPVERESLAGCRQFLVAGIRRFERELIQGRIRRGLSTPLGILSAISRALKNVFQGVPSFF